jgi:hypothetical protein
MHDALARLGKSMLCAEEIDMSKPQAEVAMGLRRPGTEMSKTNCHAGGHGRVYSRPTMPNIGFGLGMRDSDAVPR